MTGDTRVLVIDDSDVAREAMVGWLRGAGCTVFELPSAIGATREVLRNRVGVVVVDLNMPNVRGDSLAKLFRANPRFAKVRLILITGEAKTDIAKIAKDAQADAFLTKAEAPKELASLVQRLANASPAPPSG